MIEMIGINSIHFYIFPFVRLQVINKINCICDCLIKESIHNEDIVK
jgi:hypothetical protein